MTEQIEPVADMLSKTSSLKDFSSIIEASLTNESKNILGTQASDKVIKAILSLAVFGESSFNRVAFDPVAAVDEEDEPLPPDEQFELFKIAQNLGVIKQDERKPNRFVVKSPSLQANLEKILEEYENKKP